MLSSATARTGEPVLILNGKLLASKFDPRAEAKKWLDSATPLASASQVIFVLGAGSAQALEQLSQRHSQAQIIAFTTQKEIINFWNERFQNTNVQFYHLTSVDEFLDSEQFFSIIEKTFVVLEHPSSVVEASALFKALHEALLGRTYSSFRAQAEHHKSYSEISKVLLPAIGVLSIKNIADNLNLASEADGKSRSEIAVLRELVK